MFSVHWKATFAVNDPNQKSGLAAVTPTLSKYFIIFYSSFFFVFFFFCTKALAKDTGDLLQDDSVVEICVILAWFYARLYTNFTTKSISKGTLIFALLFQYIRFGTWVIWSPLSIFRKANSEQKFHRVTFHVYQNLIKMYVMSSIMPLQVLCSSSTTPNSPMRINSPANEARVQKTKRTISMSQQTVFH